MRQESLSALAVLQIQRLVPTNIEQIIDKFKYNGVREQRRLLLK